MVTTEKSFLSRVTTFITEAEIAVMELKLLRRQEQTTETPCNQHGLFSPSSQTNTSINT
jgi:hypothetical protein